LQAEFPAYQIWEETVRNQSRFVARRQHQAAGPHTVITSDVDELRTALRPAIPEPRTARAAAGRHGD
jgi:hypothetical protein